MAFKYTSRLGEHELRLLYPVSIAFHKIEFKMVTVAREPGRKYAAVSYAWGTQDATEHIFLDGQSFPVRPNLWSCLFNVAGKMGNLSLWIDAICINQEDVEEKSSQVKRMDETYAGADHVAVWLGLPSIPDEIWSRVRDPATLKTCQVEDFDWWENMEDLAGRDYWSRYWVIQEMLLGREILIWCGDNFMFWKDFQSLLCSHAGINQYSLDPHDWKSDHYPALSPIMGRQLDRYPEIRESLDTLLARHRQSECTDLRDRVFALMGIVKHEEAAMLSRFFPDYSLSEREVAVIAFAHMTQVVRTTGSSETNIIDIHSDEIFEALRIPNQKQRRELLINAEKVDYIGSESVEEIRSQLSNHDPSNVSSFSTATIDEEFLAMACQDFFSHRQKSKCVVL